MKIGDIILDPAGRGRTIRALRTWEPIPGIVGMVGRIDSGYRQGEFVSYMTCEGACSAWTESANLDTLINDHDKWLIGMCRAAPVVAELGLTAKQCGRWALWRMSREEIILCTQ